MFGRKKKGDKLDEIAKTTKAMNGELIRVREEIRNHDANNKLIQNTMQSFKTEIETLKGILLNHKNFSIPSVSSSGNLIQKIPSWQLKTKNTINEDKNDDDDKHSNSSENDTEVINEERDVKQKRSPANSDSSLEIM